MKDRLVIDANVVLTGGKLADEIIQRHLHELECEFAWNDYGLYMVANGEKP